MSANRCPNCDYDELEPDDELCPACGYKLTQTSHVWIWLGIGAIVVVAVVAILWALPGQ